MLPLLLAVLCWRCSSRRGLPGRCTRGLRLPHATYTTTDKQNNAKQNTNTTPIQCNHNQNRFQKILRIAGGNTNDKRVATYTPTPGATPVASPRASLKDD